MSALLTRRGLLAGAAGLGAVVWASRAALGTPEPKRARLVVIALDGGADGLSLTPPLRDLAYHALRGSLAIRAPLPFDADFGLHPALTKTAAMAAAGEVRIAPAAASPSLTRSHFHEQDVLQSGLSDPRGARSGWLGRALAARGEDGPLQAVGMGAATQMLLAGPKPFGPLGGDGAMSPELAWRLAELYRGEPELARLVETARTTHAIAARVGDPQRPEPGEVHAARMAARLLAAPDGPNAAFLLLDAFDTHVGQGAELGALAGRLILLDGMLDALKAETGEAWAQTAVIVFTEFGRTVRPNGTGGADHGAASTALLVGGAVKRGGLIGDWPTLRRLHEDRDLQPAMDLRSLFKGVLHEHWGMPKALLETEIFPDSAGAPLLTRLIA